MFLESWGELRSLMIPLSYVGREIFFVYICFSNLNVNLMVFSLLKIEPCVNLKFIPEDYNGSKQQGFRSRKAKAI